MVAKGVRRELTTKAASPIPISLSDPPLPRPHLLHVQCVCSLPAIGNVSFAYWGSALALAIAAELAALRNRKSPDAKRLQNGPDGYRAGDLGLDPFNLADDEVWVARDGGIRLLSVP